MVWVLSIKHKSLRICGLYFLGGWNFKLRCSTGVNSLSWYVLFPSRQTFIVTIDSVLTKEFSTLCEWFIDSKSKTKPPSELIISSRNHNIKQCHTVDSSLHKKYLQSDSWRSVQYWRYSTLGLNIVYSLTKKPKSIRFPWRQKWKCIKWNLNE